MVNNEVDFDNKSQLQEYAQKTYKTRPLYELVGTSGPEHDRIFQVNVLVDGKVYGSGEGTRKIIAEDRAAKDALEKLKDRKSESGKQRKAPAVSSEAGTGGGE
jgi:ribonuclease-3